MRLPAGPVLTGIWPGGELDYEDKLVYFCENINFIMALFTIKTKRKKICNGIQIDPGMTVQVVSPFNNPVTVNGGQAVEDAFMRMFGISLKKANALNMSDLEVKKQ